MNDICGLCFFFLFLLGSPLIVRGFFPKVSVQRPLEWWETLTPDGYVTSDAPPATAFVDSAMFLSMNDE